MGIPVLPVFLFMWEWFMGVLGKPKITATITIVGWRWFCRIGNGIVGVGESPAKAYADWRGKWLS